MRTKSSTFGFILFFFFLTCGVSSENKETIKALLLDANTVSTEKIHFAVAGYSTFLNTRIKETPNGYEGTDEFRNAAKVFLEKIKDLETAKITNSSETLDDMVKSAQDAYSANAAAFETIPIQPDQSRKVILKDVAIITALVRSKDQALFATAKKFTFCYPFCMSAPAGLSNSQKEEFIKRKLEDMQKWAATSIEKK